MATPASGRLTCTHNDGYKLYLDWKQIMSSAADNYSEIEFSFTLYTPIALGTITQSLISFDVLNDTWANKDGYKKAYINIDRKEAQGYGVEVPKAGEYKLPFTMKVCSTYPETSNNSNAARYVHGSYGETKGEFNIADIYASFTKTGGTSGAIRFNTSTSSPTTGTFELNNIDRLTTVSCPDSYIGDEVSIIANRLAPDYTHTVTYEFGDLTGTIATKSTSASIYWKIPVSFLDELPANATHGTCILTCYTYDKSGTLVGGVTTNVIIRMDVNQDGPTFAPVIKCTDATSLNLTGNENTFIKYISNASVATNAVPKGGATIASQTVTCAGKSFTNMTGVGSFTAVESAVFDIKATDSRGATSTEKVTKTLIPYSKLTCNLIAQTLTPSGILTFLIEGNYFQGSFGKVSNTLTLQYRYKVGNGAYGAWTNYTPTISSSNYYATIDITGLDYKSDYTLQARVSDKLFTVTSAEDKIAGMPIFNWGRYDFEFNVPVTSKEDFTLESDKGIYGQDADGNNILAIDPCNSIGELTIGQGNYNDEVGATKIYGNEVDIMAHNGIYFNGINIVGLVNALNNSYDFTATVTKGANYASASCSLTLRGNCLYCRFYGSRNTITGEGDFADEVIGQVSFEHGGKITGMSYVNGVAGTSGPTAALSMANVNLTATTCTFDMLLSNAAQPGRNFLASFVIPVTINTNAFVE